MHEYFICLYYLWAFDKDKCDLSASTAGKLGEFEKMLLDLQNREAGLTEEQIMELHDLDREIYQDILEESNEKHNAQLIAEGGQPQTYRRYPTTDEGILRLMWKVLICIRV